MSVPRTILCRFLRSIIRKLRFVNFRTGHFLRKCNINSDKVARFEDNIEESLKWCRSQILIEEASHYMPF